MILYHPIKDANHCMYRLLNVLKNIDCEVSIEKLRVIDFFYVFPHLLKEVKPWPSDISEYKKVVHELSNPFEIIPNKRRAFYELHHIQKQALLTLASKGILDKDSLERGIACLIKNSIPKTLIQELKNNEFSKTDVFRLLTDGLIRTKWKSESGFKRRSGLLEYRYDEPN